MITPTPKIEGSIIFENNQIYIVKEGQPKILTSQEEIIKALKNTNLNKNWQDWIDNGDKTKP